MTVLAIAAQKGGVGKSTTSLYAATNIARALGSTAERPLVGILDRDDSKNLTDLINRRPNLLQPGVILLSGYDLPRHNGDLRVIVVDTPPGFKAIRSLEEADLIAIPAVPEDQAVSNFVKYLNLLDDARVSVNPKMRLVAVLPTMVMRNKLHETRLAEIKAIACRRRPPLVVLPPVPRRIDIARYDLNVPEYKIVTEELMRYAALAL